MKKLLIYLSLFMFTSLVSAASTTTVGFSRGTPSAKDVSLMAINKAVVSIDVAAYQLTSSDIIVALLKAKSKGVVVRVLVDRSVQNLPGNAIFVSADIECLVDIKFRIMHHKFILVDDKHIQLGSFNYSVSGDKNNAENALFITNTPRLVAKYKAQWETLKLTTKPCVVKPV